MPTREIFSLSLFPHTCSVSHLSSLILLRREVLRLVLELLGATPPPDIVEVAGLWTTARNCMTGRPAVGKYALECGIFELAVSSLRQAGR